jgi:hypothetical protein
MYAEFVTISAEMPGGRPPACQAAKDTRIPATEWPVHRSPEISAYRCGAGDENAIFLGTFRLRRTQPGKGGMVLAKRMNAP